MISKIFRTFMFVYIDITITPPIIKRNFRFTVAAFSDLKFIFKPVMKKKNEY